MISPGALLGLVLTTLVPLQPEMSLPAADAPILVGDLVPIDLVLTLPAGEEAVFPEWSETWDEAEIREVGPVETIPTADGKQRATQRLLVTFFRSGEFVLQLPPLAGGAPLSEAASAGASDDAPESDSPALEPSQSITIRVESVLPETEEIPQPQPPASPVTLAWGKPFIWTASALALAVLTMLLILRSSRRSESLARGSAALDPLDALHQALGQLRSEGNLERVFTAMSLHLRYFLGHSLAFPAPESTTSEIRRRLRSRDLPPDLISRTDRLLRQCDGIKFARQGTSPADAHGGLQEAEVIGTEMVDFLNHLAAADEEASQ